MKTIFYLLVTLTIVIALLLIAATIVALIYVIISGGFIGFVSGDYPETFAQALSHGFVDTQFLIDTNLGPYRLSGGCDADYGCHFRLIEMRP